MIIRAEKQKMLYNKEKRKLRQKEVKKMLIFLDIDGVLNKQKEWKTPYTLNDENIERFCRFAKKNQGKVILTSSWRGGFIAPHHPGNTPQIKELEKKLERFGIRILGKTPILHKKRDVEIREFLKNHPTEDYIIVDDDKNEFQRITDKNMFVDCKKGF